MASKLIDVLHQLEHSGAALGHFNVADLVLLKAVVGAARENAVPVMVGASEGERDFMGTKQIAALVESIRQDSDVAVFLNADHTHSLSKATEAARAGFDSIVFDLSSLPLEENAKQTRNAVEALKSINPSIAIEGEIGEIGSGSEIHDDAPQKEYRFTTASEAHDFVQFTKIDILAPAVGTTHGMRRAMVSGTEKKHLNIERIREIKAQTGVPLTLHGGSGTSDEDFTAAIRAGINIVHINTELRLAWRQGLEGSLAAHKDEVVPYKILPAVVEAVRLVASERLQLFTAAMKQGRPSAAA